MIVNLHPEFTAAVEIDGDRFVVPVIAFDDEGHALIPNLPSGQLVRAEDHPGFHWFSFPLTPLGPHEDSESAGEGYPDGAAEPDQ